MHGTQRKSGDKREWVRQGTKTSVSREDFLESSIKVGRRVVTVQVSYLSETGEPSEKGEHSPKAQTVGFMREEQWRLGRSPEHKGSKGRGSSPACDGGIRPPASVLRPVSANAPHAKHHPVFQDDRDLDSAQRCPAVLWEFVLNCAQEMISVLRDEIQQWVWSPGAPRLQE